MRALTTRRGRAGDPSSELQALAFDAAGRQQRLNKAQLREVGVAINCNNTTHITNAAAFSGQGMEEGAIFHAPTSGDV